MYQITIGGRFLPSNIALEFSIQRNWAAQAEQSEEWPPLAAEVLPR